MSVAVPRPDVEPVSDRRRNPFGMRPQCPDGAAVPGYGDPAADVHVIGDHPGRHGGTETGVPFTQSVPGERLQDVLAAVGLIDDPADEPVVRDLFLSYLHMCTPDGDPSDADYARLERYFDAELRAVNAHILVPVGRRATDHILWEYTTQARKVPPGMDDRHGHDVRGRGFLVVPMKEPADWTDDDRDRIVDRLGRILASDYRQTKGVATLIG